MTADAHHIDGSRGGQHHYPQLTGTRPLTDCCVDDARLVDITPEATCAAWRNETVPTEGKPLSANPLSWRHEDVPTVPYWRSPIPAAPFPTGLGENSVPDDRNQCCQ